MNGDLEAIQKARFQLVYMKDESRRPKAVRGPVGCRIQSAHACLKSGLESKYACDTRDRRLEAGMYVGNWRVFLHCRNGHRDLKTD